jgi:hypothetical protein
VGHQYAGILGPLAMSVVIVQGLRHGGGAETTCLAASVTLICFATLGYVLGGLGQYVMDDAVHSRMQRELSQRVPGDKKSK